MADDTIRGYRVVGDRPRDRQLSFEYLKQDGKSAKLLTILRTEAVKQGANCLGKPDKWTGDELPTDREAQMMCAGCGIVELCQQYTEQARPAFGVWAGQVRGRQLQEQIQSDGNMEGSARIS